MEVDKTGLTGRLFDGFAQTSRRRYLLLKNMETGVTRWSKGAVDAMGLPGEYLQDNGAYWASLMHPDDREVFLEDLKLVYSGKKKYHYMEYRIKNLEGDYVMCTCRGVVMDGTETEPPLFIATVTNHGIADNVDATTNLYNIHSFWRYLRDVKGNDNIYTTLLVGVNNFADINGVYGYDFGDKALRAVGSLLTSILGKQVQIFRMDGVRFACCFTDISERKLLRLYTQLKEEFAKGVLVGDTRIVINISGGAVEFSGNFDEYAVQNGARYALQQSKYEMGSELVIFNNERLEDNQNTLELIEHIRKCIIDDFKGFYLCFQPIMSAETETLIGAEALLRWRCEPFGEVPPGKFIPWLENDPSFFELGNWILKTAMTEAKVLLEKHPDFVLNVNVAYPQMARHNFRNSVREILAKTGYPPQNLCLELTERCRHLEVGYLRREIDRLKELGIRFAMDDFGTGFSSLDLLAAIPVDTLKIDRGFVRDIETNTANQYIVKAVTGCAQDMGVHVCLEGLEDREMINFTKQYHVYSYQGYYFSKPIVISEFVEKYN